MKVLRREPASLTEIGEEALLYLDGQHQVHLLDRTAVLVYRECERRSPEEIATLLEPDRPIEEVLPGVLQVLRELTRLGAVQVEAEVERRAFLVRAAQIATPLLLSSALPQPAAAISCRCSTSSYSVPVVTAATAGSSNPNTGTANANSWAGTTRATFSQQICVPPGATQVNLSVGSALIDDAFSVTVNGLNTVARSRSYTSNATWTVNDTCGAPAATNVLIANPVVVDLTPIFSGLRTGGCDTFTLNFTHCNYQGGTGLPTLTINVV